LTLRKPLILLNKSGASSFQHVSRQTTYALFPLLILLMPLTSGRETMLAFKGYAAVLIWIQLWPPLPLGLDPQPPPRERRRETGQD